MADETNETDARNAMWRHVMGAGADGPRDARDGYDARDGHNNEHDATETARTYTIREVARMFRMQPSTLRYYEEQGLLTGVERTETGQRVYRDRHVNRLRSICCLKHAGMSIEDLKRFFAFESDEKGHLDEIMDLLEARREAIVEQERLLAEAHAHILRKLHFYGDIRSAAAAGAPRPSWDDYRNAVFRD